MDQDELQAPCILSMFSDSLPGSFQPCVVARIHLQSLWTLVILMLFLFLTYFKLLFANPDFF